MLKKTITYKNPFTDETKTEDFYFNINKAEATKLAMIEGEGLDERLREMIATNNIKEVLAIFERFITLGFGKREGDDFIKSPDLSARFIASEAYSEMFLEFIKDPNKLAAFINGLVPQDLEEFAKELMADAQDGEKSDADPNDKRPAWIRENREPTKKELDSMTKVQLVEVMQRKNQNA